MLVSLLFMAVASATSTSSPENSSVSLPLQYTYGGYPKISTDLYMGDPASGPINTVVDLGSANFWLYGPNATVFWGSPYLGVEGPCNFTPSAFFDYKDSSTASAPNFTGHVYSYGGNGKIVHAPLTVKDTLSFAQPGFPAFENIEVALSNYTLLKQNHGENCLPMTTYDLGILGLSAQSPDPFRAPGPSFRGNLLSSGAIKTKTLSMWFDEAPSAVNGTFTGQVEFGAEPDSSKYEGDLVHVRKTKPEGSFEGLYYVPYPKFSASTSASSLKSVPFDGEAADCLLDSGTGQDYLPVNREAFFAATGLVDDQGFPAYNGSCEFFPKELSIDYTFEGFDNKTSVTIKVPLRNYARGLQGVDSDGICPLALELGDNGSCTLGAPFFTAAYLALNDDTDKLWLAQGGIAKKDLY